MSAAEVVAASFSCGAVGDMIEELVVSNEVAAWLFFEHSYQLLQQLALSLLAVLYGGQNRVHF